MCEIAEKLEFMKARAVKSCTKAGDWMSVEKATPRHVAGRKIERSSRGRPGPEDRAIYAAGVAGGGGKGRFLHSLRSVEMTLRDCRSRLAPSQ